MTIALDSWSQTSSKIQTSILEGIWKTTGQNVNEVHEKQRLLRKATHDCLRQVNDYCNRQGLSTEDKAGVVAGVTLVASTFGLYNATKAAKNGLEVPGKATRSLFKTLDTLASMEPEVALVTESTGKAARAAGQAARVARYGEGFEAASRPEMLSKFNEVRTRRLEQQYTFKPQQDVIHYNKHHEEFIKTFGIKIIL